MATENKSQCKACSRFPRKKPLIIPGVEVRVDGQSDRECEGGSRYPIGDICQACNTRLHQIVGTAVRKFFDEVCGYNGTERRFRLADRESGISTSGQASVTPDDLPDIHGLEK